MTCSGALTGFTQVTFCVVSFTNLGVFTSGMPPTTEPAKQITLSAI